MLSKVQFLIQEIFASGQDLLTSSTDLQGLTKPTGAFVKGINFGGGAVTIEGHSWDAYETALAQGLSVPDAHTLTTKFMPQPYVPKSVRRMLNGVIYKPQVLDIYQTLPNGNYEVYLWMMENYQPQWHSFDIRIGGQTIATEVGKLPVTHWERYGPYPVTLTDGMLRIAIAAAPNPNIDAHLMGMSIFQVN